MKSVKNVFATAWLLAKFGQKKFGGKISDYFMASLKIAYAQIKSGVKSVKEVTKTDLINMMLVKTIVVSFYKKDGTKRFMFGTLNRQYIDSHSNVSNSGKTRTVPEHQVIIFDTEINEYRSFILDNLVDYAIVD